MNANKMWCKSRFFIFNTNAFYKDADAKCQYDTHVLLLEVQFSWYRCPMQGCRCKVDPWWCQRTYLTVMQMSFCKDGDAKCLVVQMPSNGYVMMQMLLVGMSWCKCSLCGYAMMQMLWCKHTLFKNSLYFQNEVSLTPETKIFSKLDLLFMKSHLLFDLRLPKK